MKKNLIFKGIPISKGIAIGKPFFLLKEQRNILPDISLSSEEVSKEIKRYQDALKKSKNELEHLQKRFIKDGASVIVQIVDVHLELLYDPVIKKLVEQKIKKTKKTTEIVVKEVLEEYKENFKNIKDEVIQERIDDIKDVSQRILNNLQCVEKKSEKNDLKEGILLAFNLIPSDALEARMGKILGFVSEKGGYTSHSGIIARAKNIPYITNININSLKEIDIDCLIIDTFNGKIIVNPDQDTIKKYNILQKKYFTYLKKIRTNKLLEAKTKDGTKINIFSNIEKLDDVQILLKYKAKGIGLFRSEYLFATLKKDLTEENQFQFYKKIMCELKDKLFVIRLFDIGMDKIYFMNKNKNDLVTFNCNESNPALGCRSIRFLLKNENIFQKQIRAILRASIYGNLRILIPFICDISEFRTVKKKIEQIKIDLKKEGYKIANKILLGCMMEIPSSAIMADVFAKEADFLSIGTNDLTQFTIAADRTNSEVSHLYDFSYPSLLRFLKIILKEAKLQKKEVFICGEIAGDINFTKLLIGMGIRNLSIAPQQIPFIKHIIKDINIKNAKKTAEKAFNISDALKLKKYLLEENEAN